MIHARKAKIKTYKQQAILEGADFKYAKEIIRQANTIIKEAIKEGKLETRPLIIAGCSDATVKLIKSKLLSKGYFFTLSSNNQVLKIFLE